MRAEVSSCSMWSTSTTHLAVYCELIEQAEHVDLDTSVLTEEFLQHGLATDVDESGVTLAHRGQTRVELGLPARHQPRPLQCWWWGLLLLAYKGPCRYHTYIFTIIINFPIDVLRMRDK